MISYSKYDGSANFWKVVLEQSILNHFLNIFFVLLYFNLQLVQSKIRMNVNFEASKCHIRSQSMADSVHSVHSLMGGNTPLGSRIHPVQRYSSEG